MSAGAGSVRSVSRALALLGHFDAAHPVWALGDLARVSGLPKSTTLRLLATLEAEGMVWTRPDGRFGVGAGLLRWVGLARSAWELTAQAQQVLADVAERTRESSGLYVRQGLTRVLVARHEGPRSLRHVLTVGHSATLTVGAASWVLLSQAPDDVVAAVAALDDAPPDVADRVAAARERGWARSDGEREVGVSGVAVPVPVGPGGPAAALSVGGPTSRFDDDAVAGFVTVLAAAADRLRGEVLTAGPPPP